jgi:hypothetical protein
MILNKSTFRATAEVSTEKQSRRKLAFEILEPRTVPGSLLLENIFALMLFNEKTDALARLAPSSEDFLSANVRLRGALAQRASDNTAVSESRKKTVAVNRDDVDFDVQTRQKPDIKNLSLQNPDISGDLIQPVLIGRPLLLPNLQVQSFVPTRPSGQVTNGTRTGGRALVQASAVPIKPLAADVSSTGTSARFTDTQAGIFAVAEGEYEGSTCMPIDHVDATPGTTIYADESVTLDAVLSESGDLPPDSYLWTGDGASGSGTQQTTVGMLEVGDHDYTVTATCSGNGQSSSSQKTVTVNPVTVASISVAKTGGNMVYPNTIYVGDTVTFTATYNPAGHTPEMLSWDLTLVYRHLVEFGGNITTEEDRIPAGGGAGQSWSTTVDTATTEWGILTTARYYEVKATATSGGHASTQVTTFEVLPYLVTGMLKSGGTNEGDTQTYTALTNPGIDPVGDFSWSHTRTSSWGSSDEPGIDGMGKVVTKAEVDPGEWNVSVTFNSGGHDSFASTSVTINAAKISGATLVSSACDPTGTPPGTLIVEYQLTSSTGRLADLDHSIMNEQVTYLKNDGSAPNPMVSDPPFVIGPPTGVPNPKIKAFGEMPGSNFYDVHTPAPVVDQQTTGQLTARQKYFATYTDAQDPTANDFFSGGGPFDIIRYIEDDGTGALRYRVTKQGASCTGPVPGPPP